jgi:ankyrin repeat protein
MELLDLSHDVLRQIMIYYVNNSKVNQKKIEFIGSHKLNEVNNNINEIVPLLFDACKNNNDRNMNTLHGMFYDEKNALQLINEYDSTFIDEYGDTSLMWACRNAMFKVADKLLDIECLPGQINKDGNTALIYACNRGMTLTIEKLFKFDCKRLHVNNKGKIANTWSLYYA